MSAAADDGLAERLASALLTVDGVRALFPRRPPAVAALALVGVDRPDPAALVEVDLRGQVLDVSTRLATSRTAPSRIVVDHALGAIREVLGPRSGRIDIELAYIE